MPCTFTFQLLDPLLEVSTSSSIRSHDLQLHILCRCLIRAGGFSHLLLEKIIRTFIVHHDPDHLISMDLMTPCVPTSISATNHSNHFDFLFRILPDDLQPEKTCRNAFLGTPAPKPGGLGGNPQEKDSSELRELLV